MGKNTRGEKERSRERQLAHENSRLRKENNRLRRQLAKIDLDRYSHIKDIVQEHYAQEEIDEGADKMLNDMKHEWVCHECGTGHLEINLYTRAGETWYFRECNNCPNRTKSQVYSEGVKGPIKVIEPKPDKNGRK